MFGKRQLEVENEQLQAENEQLRREMARIAYDPIYGTVRKIHAMIEEIVASSGPVSDIPPAVSRAIIRHATEDMSALENTIVSSEASRQLKDVLAVFDREAADGVGARTDERVEQIQNQGVVERILQVRESTGSDQMQDFEPESTVSLRERAKELRKKTRHSHLLAFEWLKPDDEITLVFTDKDQGNHSRYYHRYGRREYNSSLEKRRIALRMSDPVAGSATVLSDSWLGSGRHKDDALRAGQEVALAAVGPNAKEQVDSLVKNAPVAMESSLRDLNSGKGKDLALWWVNIGNYLAMS